MQPNELSPLTNVIGSSIRLEDAILSSTTFILWERLFGVSRVSPTADRLSLYYLQQRQNDQEVDSLIESRQETTFSLKRPQFTETHTNDFNSISSSRNGNKMDFSESKYSQSNQPLKIPLQTRGEFVSGELSMITSSETNSKEMKNISTKREDTSFLDNNRHEKYPKEKKAASEDRVPLFSFPPPPPPPPLPPISEGKQFSINSDLLTSQRPFQSVAEEASVEFQLGDIISRRSGSGIAWMNEEPQLSRASEVLDLRDDTNDESSLVRQQTGSLCSSNSILLHPLPDPTRLTRVPISQELQWDISIEAQRQLNEEEASDDIINNNKIETLEQSIKINDNKDENNLEHQDVVVENISVFSDDQKEIFPADDSSWNDVTRGMTISSSPLAPICTIESEIPADQNSGTPKFDSILMTNSSISQPKRKERKYLPPVFYRTKVPHGIETISNTVKMDKVESEEPLYSQSSRKTSSTPQKSQSGGLINSPMISDNCDKPASVISSSCSPPVSENPIISMFTTPPPQQVRSISPIAEKFHISSSVSSSCLPPLNREGKRSPSMNATSLQSRNDFPQYFPSLKDVNEKEIIQNEEIRGNYQEEEKYQNIEEIPMTEKNEAILSFSPSPSYKDYEWATKAQEALEEQKKRHDARTPSNNSIYTPPPKQVGGFELPQLPKGRQNINTIAPLEEGEGKEEDNNKEYIESDTKLRQESCVSQDSTSMTINNSSVKPSKRSRTETISPTPRKVAKKREATRKIGVTSTVTKRARNAAISPPPTEEFALPRTVTTSESAIKQNIKRGRKKGTN